MKTHPSITPARVEEAVERQQRSRDKPGFCIICGADAVGIEPDDQRCECNVCGKAGVYGASELLGRMPLG
jgi:hypothetical protein